jgi:xanthine dehydrogenase accessory factor
MRSPDDVLLGIGAGCEGAMLVLLERAVADSRAELRLLRPRRWGGHHCLLRFTSLAIFRWDRIGCPICPRLLQLPPRKFLLGAPRGILSRNSMENSHSHSLKNLRRRPDYSSLVAGPDAQPVASAALTLGWRVLVLDHRPAYATEERFQGAEVRLVDFAVLRNNPRGCTDRRRGSHESPPSIGREIFAGVG